MTTMMASKRRFLADGLAVLLALLAYYLFPVDTKLNSVAQSIALGVAFFVILPILYVGLIRKESLSAIGLGPSVKRLGLLSVPLATISALAVLFLVVRYYPVGENYYIPSLAISSFPIFLLYEVLVVGTIAFLYEVFFRGLVQLLWLGRYGLSAVFFQFVIFSLFLLATDGIVWQSAPVLLAAVSSGFIAAYTKSLYYSWVSGWLVLFLADAYFLISK